MHKSIRRRGWHRGEPLDDELRPEEPRVLARSLALIVEAGLKTVPLGSADVPESCSFRALVSSDSLPLSRPRAIKSAENARIYAPHLKVFRQ